MYSFFSRRRVERAPADLLLPEILEHIFTFAHPQVDILHTTKAKGSSTWTLSYVSRAWRTVALETKGLWTSLLLDFDPEALNSSRTRLLVIPPAFGSYRARLALSRSGTLPISVFVRESSEFDRDSESLREPIFANSHRIHTYADQAWGALDWLEVFASVQFPQLQSLRLSGYGTPLSCRTLEIPSLRSLHLERFRLPFFHPSDDDTLQIFSQVPWSQLTHLTMERACLSFYLFSMTKSLLQQLINLEYLAIKEEADVLAGPMERSSWKIRADGEAPVPLTNLKAMFLRGRQELVLCLLSTIQTPSLTNLHVEVAPLYEWRVELEDNQGGWPLVDGAEEALSELWPQVLRKFFDHLDDKSSITSLCTLGLEATHVTDLVGPLEGLQALTVDRLEPELITCLTWRSSPDHNFRPLPDLQLLTWIIPEENEYCDEIVGMIRSRLTGLSTNRRLRRIRLLYTDSFSEDTLKRRFLPRLRPVVANFRGFSIETEPLHQVLPSWC